MSTGAAPDDLVLRYLGAFGPASVQDVQVWSGLTRVGEVADRLGSRVRRFRDEAGRVLLDGPDAPRPPADTPAPIRFLPEYDNLLLSHADRTRVVPEPAHRAAMAGQRWEPWHRAGGRFLARQLGNRARRRTGPSRDRGVPAVVSASPRGCLAAEGQRLLAFAAAEAEPGDIRISVTPSCRPGLSRPVPGSTTRWSGRRRCHEPSEHRPADTAPSILRAGRSERVWTPPAGARSRRCGGARGTADRPRPGRARRPGERD